MKHARWVVCVALLLGVRGMAQDHPWAGRPLDALESAIHERLASLPFHGVFDSVNFEIQGKTVVLSGQVSKATVKERAERAVRTIDGVGHVVNRIQVAASSRQDDALRLNLYRAIYETPGARGGSTPLIHIVVNNGLVTLEGVVQSDSDRSTIYLSALNVTSHVVDNLRVAQRP